MQITSLGQTTSLVARPARAAAPDGYAGSVEAPPRLLDAARHLLQASGPLSQTFSVPGDKVSHSAPLVNELGVFVMKDRRIQQYDKAGQFVRSLPGDNRPSLQGDLLFVQDYHTVRAFPAAGGEQPLWSKDVGRGGGAVRHQGVVYLGGEPEVKAIDEQTGAPRWATGYKEVTSFSVIGLTGGTLLARSQGHVETHDQFVRGYDPQTGKERWKLEVDSVQLAGEQLFGQTSRAGIPPFLSPQTVIRCLNPKDGSTRWKLKHKGSEKIRWTAGSDGTVYVVRGQLEAHRDGKLCWSKPADPSFDLAPVVTEKELLLSSGRGSVMALDRATGETRWRQDDLGEMLVPPSLGPDGTLYVKTREGPVKALQPFDAQRDLEPMAPSSVQVGPDRVVLQGVRLNVRNPARSRD